MNEKKNLRRTIVAASVFVVMLILYLTSGAWSSAIYNKLNPADTADTPTGETAAPELLPGEYLGPNNRILMFAHTQRDSIKSIEVHNEHGEYKFIREETGFKLEGYNNLYLNSEGFSSLIVATGYTLTSSRVTAEATEADLAEFGLAEPVAYWILNDNVGNTYKVYVGDKLVSEEGYYAMLEGREGCVYILSTSLETSVLSGVETYVEPLMCYGMTDQDYYFADNFTVMHGDDLFISVKQSKKEDFVNPDAQAETKLIYPAGYKTDDTFFMSDVLTKFVSMVGEETVYLGDDDERHAEYGLEDPYYKIAFDYTVQNETLRFIMFVSEQQEDGNYYAVSNLNGYKLVAKFTSETFWWLESDLIDWVDDYPIMINIQRINSIGVKTSAGDYTFNLKHSADAEGNVTLEIDEASGFHMDDSEVLNFREFYKVLLSVQIRGNITHDIGEDNATLDELTDEEIAAVMADASRHMATVTFNMSDGSKNEYSFYRYSTRRAILSANGDTSFYVLADWIEKLEDDLDRLLQGIEIDSHDKK